MYPSSLERNHSSYRAECCSWIMNSTTCFPLKFYIVTNEYVLNQIVCSLCSTNQNKKCLFHIMYVKKTGLCHWFNLKKISLARAELDKLIRILKEWKVLANKMIIWRVKRKKGHIAIHIYCKHNKCMLHYVFSIVFHKNIYIWERTR